MSIRSKFFRSAIRLKKAFFCVGLFYFVASCTLHPSSTNSYILSLPDNPSSDQSIKNNFELERIVPIETTDIFLLGNIKRVIFYKEKLIILDREWPNVFVVDANTGIIETHIKRRGQGPGESRLICDIAFDDRMEHILVFNDYNKLLTFSLDGRFLKEERIDGLYENMTYEDGNVLFYNKLDGYSCFPHAFLSYNLTTKKWKAIGELKSVEFGIRGRGCLLVKSKNIWFTPVLNFGLNVLKDEKMEIPYLLEAKNKLTDELIKKSTTDGYAFLREVREKNICYYVQSIRETEKHIIFITSFAGFMILEKKSLELHRINWVEDVHLGIRLFHYHPHDGDDNRIMFVVRAEEWANRMPNNNNDLPDHLKKQIENVDANHKFDDNPILVFYKEK